MILKIPENRNFNSFLSIKDIEITGNHLIDADIQNRLVDIVGEREVVQIERPVLKHIYYHMENRQVDLLYELNPVFFDKLGGGCGRWKEVQEGDMCNYG